MRLIHTSKTPRPSSTGWLLCLVLLTGLLGVQSLPARAEMAGNAANHAGRTLGLQTGKISPSLAVASSANPTDFGTSADITATVTGAGTSEVATGTVQFKMDGVAFGAPVPLDGQGKASKHLSYLNLWPGAHTIAVFYSGDDVFSAGDNAGEPFYQFVNKAGPVFMFDPPIADVEYGQSVAYTLTVTGDLPTQGIPGGMVQLLVDGAATGSALALDEQGVARFAPVTWGAAGNHSIAVSYSGDDYFLEVPASAATAVVVGQGQATASVIDFSPAAGVVGQDITVRAGVEPRAPATTTPSGTVTINAGSDSCTATYDAGYWVCVLRISRPGQPDLTATYNGDGNFEASKTSVPTAGPAIDRTGSAVVIDGFAPPTVVVGQPVTVAFSIRAVAPGRGAPTGTVTITAGSLACSATVAQGFCQLTPPHAVPLELTAAYGGDDNFLPGTSPAAGLTPGKAATGLALTSSNPAVPFGAPVTFVAEAQAQAPGAGLPTGQVQFKIDGAPVFAPVDLRDGKAVISTIITLATGAHAITADYLGDPDFAPGTGSMTQTVVPAPTTVELSSTRNPSQYGTPVTIWATVSAEAPSEAQATTGQVQFLVDGRAFGSPVALNGEGKASKLLPNTALWVGEHSISASYLGSASFLPSNAALPLLQNVLTADPAMTVTADPSPALFGQPTLLAVTMNPQPPTLGTPSGQVQFGVDGSAVGGLISLDAAGRASSPSISSLAVGSHEVTVHYFGDDYFAPRDGLGGVVVVQASTTLSITAITPNQPAVNQDLQIDFRASAVAPGAGAPTGVVTVTRGLDGCRASLDPDGTGRCQLKVTYAATTQLSAEYGGSESFKPSNVSILEFTVDRADTGVALSSSPAPSAFGQTVSFTATVSGAYGGTPTGSVTFADAGTTLCDKVELKGNREAICQVNGLAASTHNQITARYSGDDNYKPGTSGNFTQVVEPAGATVTLAAAPNPSAYLQAVTLTATVAGQHGGTPTGAVLFLDSGTPICPPAALDGNRQATCAVNSLLAGPHIITAAYSGDASYQPAVSPAFDLAVDQAATAVGLVANPTPSAFQQTVTLTATVTGAFGGTPTGSVTFLDGDNTLCDSRGLTGGEAVCTVSTLTTGPHDHIRAHYNGDANFAQADSSYLSQDVNRANVFSSLVADSGRSTFGQAVTFMVEVTGTHGGTPTGMVTFFNGGYTLCGTAVTLVNRQASCTVNTLEAGMHANIRALYSGDANFNSSQTADLAYEVEKANSAVSAETDLAASIYGRRVTFTATVSGVLGRQPTGDVKFEDNGTVLCEGAALNAGKAECSITTLAAGTHGVVASYEGDDNYNGSVSSAVTQTVTPAGTAAVLVVGPSPSGFGQEVTLSAAVTSSEGAVPTGTVRFVENGATLCDWITLAEGTAVCRVNSLTVGQHPGISVEYTSGSANFTSSASGPLTHVVEQAATTLTLSASPTPAVFNQPVTLTASVAGVFGGTPTGTVRFTDGSTTICAAANVDNGQATCTTAGLAIGSHAGVSAAYSGDISYLASVSNGISLQVEKARAVVRLESRPVPSTFGQLVTLTATVSGPFGGTPVGQVSFFDGNRPLCEAVDMTGGQAICRTSTLTGGDHQISASYSGDDNYQASVSGSLAATVKPAATTLALVAGPTSPVYGQTVTFTATLSGLQGAAPTGKLVITDGSQTLCESGAWSGGQASCQVTNLPAGPHDHVKAGYAGDNNYQASVSAEQAYAVAKADTSTTLTASPAQSTFGQQVTLVAVVTRAYGGPLTGKVSFVDGSTPLCASLDLVNGHATCQVGYLPVGSHDRIAATYLGDGNNSSSASSALVLTVVRAETNVVLTANPTPSMQGQAVTLTAIVSGAYGGMPTGKVTFMDGGSTLCDAVNLDNGKAVCPAADLATGPHASLSASYSGDANFKPGVSAPLKHVVLEAAILTVTSSTQTVWTIPTGQSAVLPTSIQIPAGAVHQDVKLVYYETPGITNTLPGGYQLVRNIFNLDVYVDGVLQPAFQFDKPLALSLAYDPAEVDENTVDLRRRQGNAWSLAGTTVTGRNKAEHQVTASVTGAGKFATLARTQYRIYCPTLQK